MASLGLGLSTLAAVALIQGNIRAQMRRRQLPEAARQSFFFIDIQNEQLAQLPPGPVARATRRLGDFHQVPSLRARVVALKGVPVDQVQVSRRTAAGRSAATVA